MGLRLAKSMNAKKVLLKSDSRLVIESIKGDYEAKEQRMQNYLKLTNQLVKDLEQVEFIQVPRNLNMEADEVVRQASSEAEDDPLGIKMEVQEFPSIEEFHTFVIQGSTSWIAPIIFYLKDGHLPSDSDEARKIKKRATRFTLLNDALYKKGFSLSYLKCVEEDEARYILEEVHEGICGDHTGPKSLISKITKTGYF
ncbi:uncharacterized protein LOC142635632 [Castanea sativa]|uniref:uncharacterized protein LOC142635632 n=1 Tax=Castanea sativa TaxID=21020 RepID=UPI003F64FBBB